MRSPVRALFLVGTLHLLAGLPTQGSAQSWRTVTMSRQLSGESGIQIRVRYGAGQLSIGPAEAGTLYRMHLRYDEETFEPVARYGDDRIDLGLESIRKHIDWPGEKDSGEMELLLARNVPMDLDLEFGAVKAFLDLGGLQMTRLDLSTGASESRVRFSQPNPVRMESATFQVGAADFQVRDLGNLNADRISVDAGVGSVVLSFTGRWQRDATVSVDMGLGALELRFPEGLGVRVVKNTFLTSLDSEGLVKRGDSYYSVDWEEADHRVTVTVDAAFGSIDVVWVR
ncbi:MAG: hypothetical protein ACWGSQ_10225 [Longimicrobiales bacterium]